MRACLAGGSDEDEPNEDREVESESCDRLAPRLFPLDFPLLYLPLPLLYFVFGGHVAILIQEEIGERSECERAERVSCTCSPSS